MIPGGKGSGIYYTLMMDQMLGKGAFAQVFIARKTKGGGGGALGGGGKSIDDSEPMVAVKAVDKENLTKKCG